MTGRFVFLAGALAAVALAPRGAAAQQPAGGKQVFNPPNARPGGVLSAAVRAGNIVFLSGALGTRPGGGGLAEGGIQGQTRQALENIKASAALAGVTMEDMVKCTVFLTDVKDFQGMNQVYREFFPSNPPARSTVAVAGLVVPGAVIEIECIAAKP
ncbi:MAG TPA: RidA family protein [Gemmatimonadaceae bacterium]|jgi:reactive intermediate/imine deaminase|nr:RidA family protein [Gemmatimonadaceae bacterium]